MAASTGAIRAGRAFVEIFAIDKGLERTLQGAGRKLENFGARAKAVGAGMMAVSAAILAPMAAAISIASDAEETMNKFNVVFGDSAKEVKSWGDTFASEMGRSREQIARFMAGSQDLFVPLGFQPGAATEMSKQITQLAIDLASFNNMADDDTLRDLHAALTGSGEVMKKYGVIVSEAAVKQELFNQGIDPKKASDQEKVQARLAIIMRGTTAAQGDAARSAGSFANQMKALRARLSDTAATIGSALLPVVTPLLTRAAEIATTFGKWAEQNTGLIVTIAKIALGVGAAGAAIVAIGTVMSSATSIIMGTTMAVKALSVAMTIAAAHPVVALLAGLAAIAAAYWAISKAAQAASASSSLPMERSAKTRDADVGRFQELQRLADKQKLSNTEMERAQELLSVLSSRYGDLGISLDAAAGKIDGMTGAQKKLNEAMRKIELNELEMELRDVKHQFEQAAAEMQTHYQGNGWNAWFGSEADRQDLGHQMDQAESRRMAIMDRMDLLRGGNAPDALSADSSAAGAEAGRGFMDGFEDTIDVNQSLLDEIARLSTASISDPFIRAIEEIKRKYDAMSAAAIEAGQDQALVERARELAMQQAIAAEEERLQVERDAERQREQAEQERQAAAAQTVQDRIDELAIDLGAGDDGQKARERLELDRQRALRSAETDPERALIEREYGMRRQLLDQQEKTGQPGQGPTAGTFSAAAAAAMGRGTGQDPLLKVNQDTLAVGNQILAYLKRLGLS